MEIIFHPIGTIHTPFQDLADMPIQPSGEASAAGTIEIFPQFSAGLKDLEGFSHIIVLYYFHQAKPLQLQVVPFLDSEPRGIFATRAPLRPNPIGLSVVRLQRIEGSLLFVERLDALDGTPLLDIKPYVPEFDERENVRIGWLEQARGKARFARSDNRFKDSQN
jgi:tRNA-Thr(GGU) m(6)t(6)A37 methyltransferase TsaA